jgi:hypothetical protein
MRTVVEDLVAGAVGATIGLAVLLFWPDRQGGDKPWGMLLLATTVWLIAAALVERLAFGRWPKVMRPRRPWQFSVPSFVGVFAALLWMSLVANSAVGDRAVAAYVVAIPLVLAGTTISEYLWARHQAAAVES